MSVIGRMSLVGSIGGLSFNATTTRSADTAVPTKVTLDAAIAGTLSTRTSDTVGTLTLAADHGIETADTIDIYWSGGAQYDVTVGTVSGTSVPITGGTGPALPAQATAVTASEQQVIDLQFDGDDINMLAIYCANDARVSFFEGATNEFSIDIEGGEVWFYADDAGWTNPLASEDVSSVVVSQSSTTAADLRLGYLLNSAG